VVQVVWTRRAAVDLVAIRDHISLDRPLAAERMAARLRAAGESLADFPERGRRSGSVRELPAIYPYIIRYVVIGDMALILRIKHGA
jgi:toxin ParE1/3/4